MVQIVRNAVIINSVLQKENKKKNEKVGAVSTA